jgi:hypothetical protein
MNAEIPARLAAQAAGAVNPTGQTIPVAAMNMSCCLYSLLNCLADETISQLGITLSGLTSLTPRYNIAATRLSTTSNDLVNEPTWRNTLPL